MKFHYLALVLVLLAQWTMAPLAQSASRPVCKLQRVSREWARALHACDDKNARHLADLLEDISWQGPLSGCEAEFYIGSYRREVFVFRVPHTASALSPAVVGHTLRALSAPVALQAQLSQQQFSPNFLHPLATLAGMPQAEVFRGTQAREALRQARLPGVDLAQVFGDNDKPFMDWLRAPLIYFERGTMNAERLKQAQVRFLCAIRAPTEQQRVIFKEAQALYESAHQRPWLRKVRRYLVTPLLSPAIESLFLFGMWMTGSAEAFIFAVIFFINFHNVTDAMTPGAKYLHPFFAFSLRGFMSSVLILPVAFPELFHFSSELGDWNVFVSLVLLHSAENLLLELFLPHLALSQLISQEGINAQNGVFTAVSFAYSFLLYFALVQGFEYQKIIWVLLAIFGYIFLFTGYHALSNPTERIFHQFHHFDRGIYTPIFELGLLRRGWQNADDLDYRQNMDPIEVLAEYMLRGEFSNLKTSPVQMMVLSRLLEDNRSVRRVGINFDLSHDFGVPRPPAGANVDQWVFQRQVRWFGQGFEHLLKHNRTIDWLDIQGEFDSTPAENNVARGLWPYLRRGLQANFTVTGISGLFSFPLSDDINDNGEGDAAAITELLERNREWAQRAPFLLSYLLNGALDTKEDFVEVFRDPQAQLTFEQREQLGNLMARPLTREEINWIVYLLSVDSQLTLRENSPFQFPEELLYKLREFLPVPSWHACSRQHLDTDLKDWRARLVRLHTVFPDHPLWTALRENGVDLEWNVDGQVQIKIRVRLWPESFFTARRADVEVASLLLAQARTGKSLSLDAAKEDFRHHLRTELKNRIGSRDPFESKALSREIVAVLLDQKFDNDPWGFTVFGRFSQSELFWSQIFADQYSHVIDLYGRRQMTADDRHIFHDLSNKVIHDFWEIFGSEEMAGGLFFNDERVRLIFSPDLRTPQAIEQLVDYLDETLQPLLKQMRDYYTSAFPVYPAGVFKASLIAPPDEKIEADEKKQSSEPASVDVSQIVLEDEASAPPPLEEDSQESEPVAAPESKTADAFSLWPKFETLPDALASLHSGMVEVEEEKDWHWETIAGRAFGLAQPLFIGTHVREGRKVIRIVGHLAYSFSIDKEKRFDWSAITTQSEMVLAISCLKLIERNLELKGIIINFLSLLSGDPRNKDHLQSLLDITQQVWLNPRNANNFRSVYAETRRQVVLALGDSKGAELNLPNPQLLILHLHPGIPEAQRRQLLQALHQEQRRYPQVRSVVVAERIVIPKADVLGLVVVGGGGQTLENIQAELNERWKGHTWMVLTTSPKNWDGYSVLVMNLGEKIFFRPLVSDEFHELGTMSDAIQYLTVNA